MNFGKWIYRKLNQMDRRQAWLIKRAGLSGGSIQRWAEKGQQPRLDTYLEVCKAIAKADRKSLEKVVLESLQEDPNFWRDR